MLIYKSNSIYDEESWGLDSYTPNYLNQISSIFASYGQLSSYLDVDYYQITPGVGSFKLIVSTEGVNSTSILNSWLTVSIIDIFGSPLVLEDVIRPDIYTDSITFTSSNNNSYYVKIANSSFSVFNYVATLDQIYSGIRNSPPTGIVLISGSLKQGSILSATNSLQDADGLGSISYTWMIDGKSIATGPIYTPSQIDVGKYISVAASYTDKIGTRETVSSSSQGPIANTNDIPYVYSTPVLEANEDSIYTYNLTTIDADGDVVYFDPANTQLPNWLVRNGSVFSGTPKQSDVGTHKVKISITDNNGGSNFQEFSITVKNINDAPTGGILITGERKASNVLNAISTLADEDGIGQIEFSWKVNGNFVSKGSTYSLNNEDIGRSISVTANYKDAHGTSESVNSAVPSAYLVSGAFPLTGHQIVDITTNGYKWHFDSNAPRTINWSVSSSNWIHPTLRSGETQQDFALAFSSIAEFINVDFNFIGYINSSTTSSGQVNAGLFGSDINISLSYDGINSNGSEIIDGFFNDTSSTAFARFPTLSAALPYSGAAGDVWMNWNNPFIRGLDFEQGTEGYGLFLHEVLHTLGLKHPHDSGGTGRPTYESLGANYIDRQWFSVMSYDQFENGGDGAYRGSIPIGPMLFDAISLQYLYGESDFNSQDTIYDLRRYVGNYYNCQWDSAGIDTIDGGSLDFGISIDLNFARESNGINEHHVGYITSIQDALSISERNPDKWTWLWGEFENINGSSFGDIIFGNELDNVLNGGEGNDFMRGGAGDDKFDWAPDLRSGADTMEGGTGNDVYIFDSFSDVIVELPSEGNDTVYVGSNFTLEGTEIENIGAFSGTTANLKLDGSAAGNYMAGGLGQDTILGAAGNDTIDGGAGFDFLNGGSGTDLLQGGEGSDTLLGGLDSDTLFGGAGDDILDGNSSNDWLEGGAGNDMLTGGSGNDTMQGGDGVDVAIFTGTRGDYSITRTATPATVVSLTLTSSAEGTDFLEGIEHLRFGNGTTYMAAPVDVDVRAWKTAQKLVGLDVAFGSANQVTDTAGLARFVSITELSAAILPTVQPTAGSNVQGSGSVTLQDAVSILKMIAGQAIGTTPVSRFQSLAADFDASGTVSLADALGALRHAIGVPAPTPSWVFVEEGDDALPSILSPGIPGPVTVAVTPPGPIEVNLIGVLRGDVDGSYGVYGG